MLYISLSELFSILEVILGDNLTFSISALSVGFTKTEILDLFFRTSEKCFCENEILCFVLLAA